MKPALPEGFRTLTAEDHPIPEEGVKELLAALPPEPASTLIHLLDCPFCQDIALAELAGMLETCEEAPREDPDRAQTEALLTELLALPAESRGKALEDRRFHRNELLDLLLEAGYATQTRDAARAMELADLALRLGGLLTQEPRLRSQLVRVFCLDGSARRLAGELKGADKSLDGAAILLSGQPGGVGLYSRSLALLRWEQGRPHDAAALLRQGAQAYGEIKRRQEQGVCLGLLGLLYLETGEVARAPWPLLRGLRNLGGRPCRLSACCSLSLALALALLGKKPEARQAREQAWLNHVLPEAAEQTEVSWLEGRLAAALGEQEEAARLLDAVRVHLLAERRIADAALACLDLAALRVATGKGHGIDRLAAELEEAGGERLETGAGIDILRDFAEAECTRGNAWKKAAVLSAFFRQACRVRFPGLHTLPWT